MSGGDKGVKRPLGTDRSLGWLTQSAVQPKKRKEIAGVGASSLMALQSEVAKTQQEASEVREGRLDAEELRARRRGGGGAVAALLGRRNAGVAERDRVDRLEIKSASDRMSDSRAALERKAELYDRLAAGAPLDEAEAERYEVDFALKGGAGGARDGGGRGVRGGAVDTSGLASATATGGLMSGDMAQERERRAWEEEVGATLRGEAAAAASAEQRHEAIGQIEAETRAGRERAAAAARQRQQAEARKKERLKAEFLRRQLEAARAKQRAGQAPPPPQAPQ